MFVAKPSVCMTSYNDGHWCVWVFQSRLCLSLSLSICMYVFFLIGTVIKKLWHIQRGKRSIFTLWFRLEALNSRNPRVFPNINRGPITNDIACTLRVCLDRTYFAETENWKHCNKIIFKCVNSAVEPIFNEKVDKKWSLWDPWTVHKCTVHRRTGQPLRLKRKKKKKLRKRRCSTNKCYPNEHLINTCHTSRCVGS